MASARITDVNIKVTGLGGNLIPTGVSISYAPGAVPVAYVSFAPGKEGDPYVSGTTELVSNVDQKKRTSDVTIEVTVDKWVSSLNSKVNKKIKFVGFLDGMNILNAVGNNSYQAVIKNKAQAALEICTHTPGLHPTSINIYKTPMISAAVDANKQDDAVTVAFNNLVKFAKLSSALPPVEYYTELMKALIILQKGEYKKYLGLEKNAAGRFPLTKIYESAVYKKGLAIAEKFFNTVDLSAVSKGAVNSCRRSEVLGSIKTLFVSGPNTLLESYLNFLQAMNCTLIISNNKMYVVPYNSVLEQPHKKPKKGQIQNEPNAAGPADYMSYAYNDNGYKDIAAVLIVHAGIHGGSVDVGRDLLERTVSADYIDEESLSNAHGVLVVKAHPWMITSAAHAQARDAIQLKQAVTRGDIAPQKTQFVSAVAETKTKTAERQGEKKQTLQKEINKMLDNYCQTKFFQARFTDRTGSLEMDFNPQWVPGVGGTFYVRETDMFVDFYVTNVTHKIETSAPRQGNASTSISFCCGRMGKEPKGSKADLYLGYTPEKEEAVKKAFLSDII